MKHFILASIVLANSCGNCPSETSSRWIYIATVPINCAFKISSNEMTISYTSFCESAPEFNQLHVCESKPAEK